MSLNVGRFIDLIELYCRGVNPELAKNKELIRDIMNIKLREFAHRTGILETKATISSVADQEEYELPADCLHVKDVIYDDHRAYKINHKQVKDLAGLG